MNQSKLKTELNADLILSLIFFLFNNVTLSLILTLTPFRGVNKCGGCSYLRNTKTSHLQAS